tara:strand:- start:84137 stop:87004 length:2868 start_codon:yes stop_codon:yes gene_type:complete
MELIKNIKAVGINTIENEEDIRFKLLHPFLESLGFDSSEIIVEKNFTIRLGKSVINKTGYKSGRLDLLCKRNAQNLFVIELKRPSLEITAEDIDQGISYARLLDNIAPFTIITNGKETKIFDTVTKQDITGKKISEESKFWANNLELGAEDLTLRFNALKNFISYSQHNLSEFCKGQIQARMKNIVSDDPEESAKYIRKLYVPREGLEETFEKFIKSNQSFFALIGDSGVGKSNSLCGLVEKYVENEFVLFYNGTVISEPPIELISRDLNLVFSANINVDRVLLHLNEIGSSVGKKVLIFIDSLDEYLNTNIASHLSELALATSGLSNIKFCISCKTNFWERILLINGTKSYLYNEVFPTEKSLDQRPGYKLDQFSSEEVPSVIKKYREYYKFTGEISPSVKETLRNGFFLRVFSELFNGHQVPDKIDDIHLIDSFLKSKLQKIPDYSENRSIKILSELGKIFVEANNELDWFDFRKGLDIEEIYNGLNTPFLDDVLEIFFTHNILIKNRFFNDTKVNFYYSKIRDYIIAFKTYRLDKLDTEEFKSRIKMLLENQFGYSAIYFYSKNCNNIQHIKALNDYQDYKFREYVTIYNNYLDKNYYNTKRLFNPYTDKEVGIIIPKAGAKLDGWFALFPCGELGLPKLIEVAGYNPTKIRSGINVFTSYKAKSIHYGNSELLVDDMEKKVEDDINKNLKEIVKERKLDLSKSTELLTEELVHNIYFKRKELNYKSEIKDLRFPRFESLYPIDLKEIKSITDTDFGFRRLTELTNILIERGISVLDTHYLPYPDIEIDQVEKEVLRRNFKKGLIPDRVEAQFSEDKIKEYIIHFFKLVDVAYQKVVEHCFPEKKKDLVEYNNFPHEFLVYMGKNGRRLSEVTIGKSQKGITEIIFTDISPFERRDGSPPLNQYTWGLGASFESVTKDRDDMYLSHTIGEYLPIRYWVYKLISLDIDNIEVN